MCLITVIALGCSRVQAPMPTALPTMTARPGWHALENEGFQIWVPDSFIGGTGTDIDAVIQQPSRTGPAFSETAKSMKQQGVRYVVFAVDSHSNNPSNVTNMLVGKESAGAASDIGVYTDTFVANLLRTHSQYEILGKDVDTTGRYPAGRITVGINTPESGDVRQVMYALKNDGVIWQIAFTTPASEFQQRTPIFDQIASSVSLPYSSADSNASGQTGSPIVMLIGAVLVIIGLTARAFIKPRPKAQPVAEMEAAGAQEATTESATGRRSKSVASKAASKRPARKTHSRHQAGKAKRNS